tara:strand:+ start:816 stop:1769 length:954 start_codon:yes stop_codon:yes gene_type:complete
MMHNKAELKFICPFSDNEELIKDGDYFLSSDGNRKYEIKGNIPRFVPESNYSDSFGFQWNKFRKTQLDSFSGTKISENRLFQATNFDKKKFNGDLVLEAGSGAGRFTEILVRQKINLYSFDYSSAVDANFLNNGDSANLTLFQGDIYNVPFPDLTFDHVICLGVLQHTPDPKGAFDSLKRKLKPGGNIYIDCYALKLHHYFQWKYLLRPITKRMNSVKLFRLISFVTPFFIPLVKVAKKIFGKAGSRIFPIVEYSQLGLEVELNKDWATLDTFDMYSPEHDHPQTISEIYSWFKKEEFEQIEIFYGENGVVARAKKI